MRARNSKKKNVSVTTITRQRTKPMNGDDDENTVFTLERARISSVRVYKLCKRESPLSYLTTTFSHWIMKRAKAILATVAVVGMVAVERKPSIALAVESAATAEPPPVVDSAWLESAIALEIVADPEFR